MCASGAALYQASYWHQGRRHVGPGRFPTKADAAAYLAVSKRHQKRRLDRPRGRAPAGRAGSDLAASDPTKRESTTAREELTLRLHVLPSRASPHRPSRAARHPASREGMVDTRTLLAPSNATTRSFGPCSATPCAMIGSHGTPAAMSTCHPSRHPPLRSHPRRRRPHRRPTPPSTGRWSGSVPCWACAGPRWLAYGWDGSPLDRVELSVLEALYAGFPRVAMSSAAPSPEPAAGPCHPGVMVAMLEAHLDRVARRS